MNYDNVNAASFAASFLVRYGSRIEDPVLKKRVVAALVDCLERGVSGKSGRKFTPLCGWICNQLPEFGDEAQVAVRVLKQSVFTRTPFAAAAKRAWTRLRPNDKITDTVTPEEAGTATDDVDTMMEDLGL
jgi:hypothetical protein